MTKLQNARGRRGFTLIELLIVIVVIAILALIVIPRVMGAGRKAKEATLRSNVQRLRSALAQFQADTGVWPNALGDVVAATGTNPTGTPSGTYKGPYLTPNGGVANTGIPANPFADAAGALATHWTYTNSDGSVVSAVTGTTLDGVAYTTL
jgi:general secretion pathway protein G